MPLSMDCAPGASPARLDRIVAEEADALIGDVVNMDLKTTCPYWPVEDLGDEFRSPIESTVPVLAEFPNGVHLEIVGGGHGDDLLIATPAIAEAMARFLRTGDAGEEGSAATEAGPIRWSLRCGPRVNLSVTSKTAVLCGMKGKACVSPSQP